MVDSNIFSSTATTCFAFIHKNDRTDSIALIDILQFRFSRLLLGLVLIFGAGMFFWRVTGILHCFCFAQLSTRKLYLQMDEILN